MNTWIIVPLSFVIIIASLATADVRLPAIISDNMVIQADVHVPIWGWADPKETITVTIGSQKQTATAGADGKWMVKLVAMKPSDTSFEMTVASKNTIIIKNILVGQVWLGSGQSNMEMPVNGVLNASEEINNARYPLIRLFTVAKAISHKPLTDCNGSWIECSPQTISSFSAVAYFFGRELHKELNQPVGLIDSAWGGTIAEAWMSMPAIKAEPDFAPIIQRYEELIKKYPNGKADYDKALAQWQKDANDAQKAGKPEPPKAAVPFGEMNPNGASLLFNGMIASVIPYGIKGVIWYQGESNTDRSYQYRKLFPTLIADWRAQWHQGDFAFLFVQIASFDISPYDMKKDSWAELRDAQLLTVKKMSNTGMAVIIDIGEANNIHPKNKQEVGRRLSLWALAKTYGYKGLQYSGPMYQQMNIQGNKIVLEFDTFCKVKGDELKGFTIAGSDRKFVPAQAKIFKGGVLMPGHPNAHAEKQMIAVWSPDVNEPVAVRYAWSDNPENCTLSDETGLPASPFRTDDWPGVTDGKK
ncbi:MAG: hypothetical protein A2Y10_10235 [Planctomycetes bacterium GWF2_41_51]|nr:MAG: hypothetical protein A2Y10_10235 [Planctomycetes bacterium GWF2_41_51]